MQPASAQPTLLRSTLPPVVELSQSESEQAADDQPDVQNGEPAQSEISRFAEFSRNANAGNPYAPPDWPQDPPLVNPNSRAAAEADIAPLRPDQPEQNQHKMLSDTITAISALQQCVASLAAVVQNAPPPQARQNRGPVPHPPPQQNQMAGQPIPTLADLIADPTTSKKRYT